MKQGKGKYYYMKGELYIGDWFQNKKHGKGQYFYKNGTIYTGDFADNKKHGHGKVEEVNGSYFEGILIYTKDNLLSTIKIKQESTTMLWRIKNSCLYMIMENL